MSKWQCRHPLEVKINATTGETAHVNCGQCVACVLRRAAVWTGRNHLEWLDHGKVGAFVTLTYDDLHLEDGNYRPVQLLLKRLRRVQHMRFYCVADYGDQFGRFHWHMLLHGVEGSDPYWQNLIDSEWPCGFADVRAILPERIGYTCGYILKKLKTVQTHRPRMSNGIGRTYFHDRGRELAVTDGTLDRYPATFKVGSRHYPMDKTCRRYLKEGFVNAGGVPGAALDLVQFTDPIERIVKTKNRDRLGGYHGDKATERQFDGTAKKERGIKITKPIYSKNIPGER